MDDLISRQAVIGAIVNKVSDIGLHDNSEVARYGATFRQHEIIDIIESLPSAHSEIEERTEEFAQNVPKEDLISRKAAIDAALSAFSRGLLASPDIRKLPSAQPEPQWIPVSERLPGENEFVLVTFGWFGRKTDPGVNIDEIKDGDWMISEVVTAWMPLPEPYRVERRTDGRD